MFTNSDLQRHIKMVHDKIKDIQCHLCEYKCSYSTHLQQHIKAVHNKIKDVQCPQCEFKCSVNGNLQTHIKMVHDKIKDFQCPQCDIKFSTNQYLQKHIKAVHNNIKDVQCPECEYKCSSNGTLQRHIKICTGKLNVSAGELAVMKCLELLGIEYEREVSPIEEHHRLRYDFRIVDKGETIYIEYDGKQHYKPVCFGGRSLEEAKLAFIKCQKHDNIKDEYCEFKKEKLIRIPYWDFENIPQILQTHFTLE